MENDVLDVEYGAACMLCVDRGVMEHGGPGRFHYCPREVFLGTMFVRGRG